MVESLRIDSNGLVAIFWHRKPASSNQSFYYPSARSLQRLSCVVNKMLASGELKVHLNGSIGSISKRYQLMVWFNRMMKEKSDGL